MTTRTAVTCPAHGNCVCIFVMEPEGRGLPAVRLPQQYREWQERYREVIVAVEHHDYEMNPDVALTALAQPPKKKRWWRRG